MPVSLLLAHLGLHGGENPLSGLFTDLLFLAGPVLVLGAAWLYVHRASR